MEAPIHVLHGCNEHAEVHLVHRHFWHAELYLLLLELKLAFVRLNELVHSPGLQKAVVCVFYLLACQGLYDLLKDK